MWNKALSDCWCNFKFSLSFTTEYKEIWKENLVIYQKSLKAFLQAPLQLMLAWNSNKTESRKHMTYSTKYLNRERSSSARARFASAQLARSSSCWNLNTRHAMIIRNHQVDVCKNVVSWEMILCSYFKWNHTWKLVMTWKLNALK